MHTNEHRGKPEIHANGWRTTLNGRGRIQELGGKFRGTVEIIEWAIWSVCSPAESCLRQCRPDSVRPPSMRSFQVSGPACQRTPVCRPSGVQSRGQCTPGDKIPRLVASTLRRGPRKGLLKQTQRQSASPLGHQRAVRGFGMGLTRHLRRCGLGGIAGGQ